MLKIDNFLSCIFDDYDKMLVEIAYHVNANLTNFAYVKFTTIHSAPSAAHGKPISQIRNHLNHLYWTMQTTDPKEKAKTFAEIQREIEQQVSELGEGEDIRLEPEEQQPAKYHLLKRWMKK